MFLGPHSYFTCYVIFDVSLFHYDIRLAILLASDFYKAISFEFIQTRSVFILHLRFVLASMQPHKDFLFFNSSPFLYVILRIENADFFLFIIRAKSIV